MNGEMEFFTWRMRRLRAAAIGSLAVSVVALTAVGIVMMRASSPPRIELLDEAGNRRAGFEMRDGQPMLVMFDSDGVERLAIGMEAWPRPGEAEKWGMTGEVLRKDLEKMGATGGGYPVISLRDPRGRIRVRATTKENWCGFHVLNPAGEHVISLNTNDEFAFLTMRNAEGKVCSLVDLYSAVPSIDGPNEEYAQNRFETYKKHLKHMADLMKQYGIEEK